MMGIEIAKQRDLMDEALDVLVPLLRGETVNAGRRGRPDRFDRAVRPCRDRHAA